MFPPDDPSQFPKSPIVIKQVQLTPFEWLSLSSTLILNNSWALPDPIVLTFERVLLYLKASGSNIIDATFESASFAKLVSETTITLPVSLSKQNMLWKFQNSISSNKQAEERKSKRLALQG